MDLVLITITALAISMVVIPLMMLLAPRLELLDQPNARKVHSSPMPRVGGWGIVLGALVPILFSLPMDPVVQAFLFGGLTLFVVGVWDDAKGLSAPPKLAAQIVAVTPAILYADLVVTRVPFLDGGDLTLLAAVPLTYLGLVGMINATNLSDGLDGLAGGESILSLLAIAVLAYQSEGGGVLLILATASIGGVLGFLRYNTHPARLFMGDSGSQFLGFTAAFLVILLSQKINLAMSPVAPLLILGLPIIDVILVFSDRISKGVSPFTPMKNHIHHRLMDLGFTHNQTVVIIYSMHAAMVIAGTFYCYSSDVSLLVWYFGLSLGFLAVIIYATSVGWRANAPESNTSALFRLVRNVKRSSLFTSLPHASLTVMVPLVLVFFSLSVQEVPRDFGLMAAVLFAIFLLDLLFRRDENSVTVRVVVYAAAVFVVFLSVRFHPPILDQARLVEVAVYGLIVAAIAIAMRLSGAKGFQTTPLDYLILFVVLALGLFTSSRFGRFESELTSAMIVKSVIILYGCEVLLSQNTRRGNALNAAVLLSLAVMGYRGLT